MPQCSIGVGGVGDGPAQARTSFVDKIHGITDKLQHSLGGHLTHDPSKTGKLVCVCVCVCVRWIRIVECMCLAI